MKRVIAPINRLSAILDLPGRKGFASLRGVGGATRGEQFLRLMTVFWVDLSR